MQRFLYSFLLYLSVPFILLRLYLRSLKSPGYRQCIAERFGGFTLPANFDIKKSTIWIHAVSVGEIMAASPLVRGLLNQDSGTQIVVTCMTPTGSVRSRVLFGNSVIHSYMPYDLPGSLTRFIKKLNPNMLILMETELWPNTVHYCHSSSVKIILANARLSEKSAANYRKIASLTKGMLRKIDFIAAQTDADAIRLIDLGANPERVEVTGSLKFIVDVNKAAEHEDEVFERISLSGRPILIAASTRLGEEEKILYAFKKCLESSAELLLIIVPRHPERFDEVTSLCKQGNFSVQRRSAAANVHFSDESIQILIGDSMGEMISYYRLAKIAFVGGSLVDTGCQNVLEPAALGIPIVVGPSQFNFATICKLLEEAGALVTVQNEDELAMQVQLLMANPEKQKLMADQGLAVVKRNQNALPALLDIIKKVS
jgi:3-deoxy-D-manno-octulosonic-acid transferase